VEELTAISGFPKGLASYSALLDLERKDPAAFRTVLDTYRDDLLQMRGDRRLSEAGRRHTWTAPELFPLPASAMTSSPMAVGAWALPYAAPKCCATIVVMTSQGSSAANPDEPFTQVLRRDAGTDYAGQEPLDPGAAAGICGRLAQVALV